jgi:hypothetical protein
MTILLGILAAFFVAYFTTFPIRTFVVWTMAGFILLGYYTAIRKWEPEKIPQPNDALAISYAAMGFCLFIVALGFLSMPLQQPSPFGWLTIVVIFIDAGATYLLVLTEDKRKSKIH